MPSVIYVAIGLPGFIRCPVDANPPVTLVKWKKDGLPLRIDKVSWSRAVALVPLTLSCLRLHHFFGWSFVWFHFSIPSFISVCFSISYLSEICSHPGLCYSLRTVHDFSIHSTLVGAKWTMGASVWQRWRRTLSAPIPACLTMPWVPWDGPLPLPWC